MKLELRLGFPLLWDGRRTCQTESLVCKVSRNLAQSVRSLGCGIAPQVGPEALQGLQGAEADTGETTGTVSEVKNLTHTTVAEGPSPPRGMERIEYRGVPRGSALGFTYLGLLGRTRQKLPASLDLPHIITIFRM